MQTQGNQKDNQAFKKLENKVADLKQRIDEMSKKEEEEKTKAKEPKEEKGVICPKCGKACKSEQGLKVHQKLGHR